MIVALNNKCNLTKEKFEKYEESLSKIKTNHKLILFPSLIHISNSKNDKVKMGAQNVSRHKKGPHTGEVSATMLKSYGVDYCIIGHSERREDGETNREVREKINRLNEEQITPILCVGETSIQREKNKYKEFIQKQLFTATFDLDEKEKEKLIVAYEPIWSIGTGEVPTNDEIEEVVNLIKELLPTSKVLYGGSVNEKNIKEIKKCENLDGYLLGGLSLKPAELKEFLAILDEK